MWFESLAKGLGIQAADPEVIIKRVEALRSASALWEKRFRALGEVTKATQEDIRKAFALAPSRERRQLRDLLNPDSPNFLGSGMPLREMLLASHLHKMQCCFINQDRSEKRRRMRYVVELSAILVRLREVSRFSTLLAQGVIESLIEGDRDQVMWSARHFAGSGPELSVWEEGRLDEEAEGLWREFIAKLNEALDDWPEEHEPEPEPEEETEP